MMSLAHSPRLARHALGLLTCCVALGACSGADLTGAPSLLGAAAPTMATVALTPARDTVVRGDTIRIGAKAADGQALSSGVQWSVSDTTIATMAGGMLQARGLGSVVVTATWNGATGKCTVTVTGTPSVSNAPATPRAEPDTITPTPATAPKPSPAPPSAPGTPPATPPVVVPAPAPPAGSAPGAPPTLPVPVPAPVPAPVPVPAPPPPPPVTPPSPAAAECAAPKPGWIFCDDFEVDRTASYFETDHANGSFTRTGGVGAGGSTGMRVHFAAGQVNAGSLHLAFGRTPLSYIRPVDAGTTVYREIYWRVMVRNQPGWTGGGGDKLSRAQSLASPSWAQAMGAHVWSGGQPPSWDHLLIDPASGTDSAGVLKTTTYNDFSNLRWLGYAQSATPLFDAAHAGSWYCVEAHVRLNDPGQANGVFELWINGAPEASRSGLNWVGSFSDYGINAVYLENFWNAGSPVAQDRFLDNFVVSTSRIGC